MIPFIKNHLYLAFAPNDFPQNPLGGKKAVSSTPYSKGTLRFAKVCLHMENLEVVLSSQHVRGEKGGRRCEICVDETES